MSHINLTQPARKTVDLIDSWLSHYITQPHPELGRSGPICPFVAPAVKTNTVVVRSVDWLPEFGLTHMIEAVKKGVDAFQSTEWESSNEALHVLIVLFPDLPPSSYWLIDESHALLKDNVVSDGLMLGQFHPACGAPAARNEDFPVNRAPLPLFAIRNMAYHDILFLHENLDWFKHYAQRFGRFYESPRRVSSDFLRLFNSSQIRLAQQSSTSN